MAYLSPGVYVHEVPSAVKPIAGVGTSTAGFIGVYQAPVTIKEPNPRFDPNKPEAADNPRLVTRTFPPTVTEAEVAAAVAKRDEMVASFGKLTAADPKEARAKALSELGEAKRNVDEAKDALRIAQQVAQPGIARLCTSFGDFEKYFGTFSVAGGHRDLAHAVFGFFHNGGTRCFVMYFNAEADIQFGSFEAIDEIAVVAGPGLSPDAQQRVVDHCVLMQDRFAIVDGREPAENEDPVETIIRGTVPSYSDFAAMYFPRIRVFDITEKREKPDTRGLIAVSPIGHVAGIYARVDNARGVHKAPANEVVQGALEVTRTISRAIQDGLNPLGINCIREINGALRLWGARTLGGDMNTDLKYINVRRLMLYLRESIEEGTQWVVFEPNDRTLWAKIVRNVSAFLTNVWRDGALFGSTPQEAFYVKCDDELNPPEVRDLGRVVTEIGVALVKPAEFVIFRISQWSGPAAR